MLSYVRCIILSLLLTSSAAASEEGLVGYWKFNDNIGQTAKDSSTSGYQGTLINGPVWRDGLFKGALEFDGIDDYVHIAMGPLGSTATISAWARSTALSLTDALWSIGSDNGPNLLFANGEIYLNTGDGGNNPFCLIPGDAAEWHLYTTVITPDYTSLYIDGCLAGRAQYRDPMGIIFHISSSSSKYYWQGLIDDVRLYNRGLTEEEIAVLFRALPNMPPLANDQTVTVKKNAKEPIPIIITADDKNKDPLTYSIVTQPKKGLLKGEAPDLIYKPNKNFEGDDSFTFKANDGKLDSNAATVRITQDLVNDPPEVSDIPGQEIDEGKYFSEIELDKHVKDPDNYDDEIIWSVSDSKNLYIMLTEKHVVYINVIDSKWTGSESIIFTARDPEGLSDYCAAVFTVKAVNDLPRVSPIPGETIDQGGNFSTIRLDDYVEDPDNEASELRWSAASSNLLVTITNRVAVITVVDPEWSGSETVAFTAEDPDGLSDSYRAIFKVNALTSENRPPQPENDNAAIDEDTAIDIPVLANDTDPDGDAVTLVGAGLPKCGMAEVAGDGIRYTPNENYNGADSFSYTISDGEKEASGAVSIDINPVNDKPILIQTKGQALEENQSITVDLYAKDVDPYDQLTFSKEAGPDFVGLSDNQDRTATLYISPGFADSGNHLVTMTVTDSAGESDSKSFNVTVGNVNTPPILNDIADQTVPENQNLDFIISATDLDPNDILSFSLENAPYFVTIYNYGDRRASLRANPNYGDSGTYSVRVKVEDALKASDSKEVSIIVGETNTKPALAPIIDPIIIDEGQAKDIIITAADSNPQDALRFWLENKPPFMSLTDNQNRTAVLHVNPEEGQAGTYDFVRVKVEDNGAPPLSDNKEFTVKVGNINNAPILSPLGNQEVLENDLKVINISAEDPDGDSLSFTLENAPKFAALTDNAGGTAALYLVPTYDDGGTYNLVKVRVKDNGTPEKSDYEEFTITIGNVNRAPIFTAFPASPLSIYEGDSNSFNVSAIDPDGGTLTFSVENKPSFLTFSDYGNGAAEFHINPKSGDRGIYDTVRIKVFDNGSPQKSVERTITITVIEKSTYTDTGTDTSTDTHTDAGISTATSTSAATSTDPVTDTNM